MRRTLTVALVLLLLSPVLLAAGTAENVTYRLMDAKEYRLRMAAAWIGQMAGVGWGEPTEFKFNGVIVPEEAFPKWTPETINQFEEDDLYVEMTFLHTLEKYGIEATPRQAGIDFANSGYKLWHANKYGRENLRKGIAPPDSGHPEFNSHADDIDYQIEADYSGIIAPGMPSIVLQLGETFGRLMNYGDGLYGGLFVGAMYSEAFFESSVDKIIQAGLKAIPEGSQYYECITDVIQWHQEFPDDWTQSWEKINDKYHLNPEYRKFSCGDLLKFNIDAKINGAFIVMGLLYGEGDPDKTIEVATRCGHDSDCNPSSAAGILFTTMGIENVPEKYTSALKRDVKFSHTPYTFDGLLDVCEKLVREAVVYKGGKILSDDAGNEIFCIPVEDITAGELEQCWEPGPIANSVFTEEEMAQISYVEND